MNKNNSNDNYFANNLKYLRQKNNMEQLELANLLGRKSSSSISEWEKGKYTPKAGVLNDIAKIFSIPLSKLMNENLSEQSITTLDKINQISSELEESRQKFVLDTASSQLEEQKKENAKVVSIKTEQQKQGIDLADLVDDSKVDWDKWVSFDGKPLTDEVKQAMKQALGKQLEDK